jgi:hypothetical protein
MTPRGGAWAAGKLASKCARRVPQHHLCSCQRMGASVTSACAAACAIKTSTALWGQPALRVLWAKSALTSSIPTQRWWTASAPLVMSPSPTSPIFAASAPSERTSRRLEITVARCVQTLSRQKSQANQNFLIVFVSQDTPSPRSKYALYVQRTRTRKASTLTLRAMHAQRTHSELLEAQGHRNARVCKVLTITLMSVINAQLGNTKTAP